MYLRGHQCVQALRGWRITDIRPQATAPWPMLGDPWFTLCFKTSHQTRLSRCCAPLPTPLRNPPPSTLHPSYDATLSSMAARRARRWSRRAACACARTRSSSRGSSMRCQPHLVWRSRAPSLGVKDSEIGDLRANLARGSSTPRQCGWEASDTADFLPWGNVMCELGTNANVPLRFDRAAEQKGKPGAVGSGAPYLLVY